MLGLTLNVVNNETRASRILDLLRFIAAATVFLYHYTFAASINTFIPILGYQAVIIFFVLSGYFISSTVLKKMNEGGWKWGDYFLKRVTRLWVVLIPCLILSYIWAKVQFSQFGETEISQYLGLKIFLGNLLFLQGILVPQYALNGPLWSLSYEFWYYILFPIFVLVFYSKNYKMKILYGLFFVAISIFVGPRIMEYFLVWMLGAIIPLVKPLKFERIYEKPIILILSVSLVLISIESLYELFDIKWPTYEGNGMQYFADLGVGITVAFMIYVIVSALNTPINLKLNIPKFLADFSYTLYLTHYPIGYIIIAWRNSQMWRYNEIEGNIIKLSFVVLILLYAWVIAFFTEKHTDKIRKFLSTFLYKKAALLNSLNDNSNKIFKN